LLPLTRSGLETFAQLLPGHTDNIPDTGSYTNRLIDANEQVLATADGNLPINHLTLDYLGPAFYDPTVHPVSSDDKIDEADSYQADAFRLHGLPQYANRIYGRELQYTDGQTELQYWFFYYYNSHPFGNHEGDWEMMQIHLDGNGTPIRAAYSQHNDGERCDWIHVQKLPGTSRPIVYVGVGSHANFYSSGTHYWAAGAVDDYAGGQVEIHTPTVIPVTVAPAWILWPGRWGGTVSGIIGSDSPRGPGSGQGNGTTQSDHPQWNDPLSWENGVSGCTESQISPYRSEGTSAPRHEIALPSPPLPAIHARRIRGRVIIDYTFRTFPSGPRRPAWILSSIKPLQGPPATVWARVRSRHGRIVQVIVGKPPYRILMSVIGKGRGRSRIISAPIR
jgi:hypothetical protein